jgi:hypothetical protein
MFTGPGPSFPFFAFDPHHDIVGRIDIGNRSKARLCQAFADDLVKGGRILQPSFGEGEGFN